LNIRQEERAYLFTFYGGDVRVFNQQINDEKIVYLFGVKPPSERAGV